MGVWKFNPHLTTTEAPTPSTHTDVTTHKAANKELMECVTGYFSFPWTCHLDPSTETHRNPHTGKEIYVRPS